VETSANEESIVTEKKAAAAEATRWVSYAEAERLFGLSRTTFWRLAKEKKIRAARIGRAVRVECASVEAYLEHLADDFR
jgi:excisionase family DNA binding protein